MPAPRSRSARKAKRPKRATRPARAPRGFVGREASPVLERYPPKDSGFAPAGPSQLRTASRPASAVAPVAAPPAGPTTPAASSAAAAPPATPLITLDRPFDLDEFSSLLGETSIRITVPRDALLEVLRRVNEFMGFGIYVYAVSVRPAPTELLKSFVVELQRVDYSAAKGAWVPFVEQGSTDSPFGPTGDRR